MNRALIVAGLGAVIIGGVSVALASPTNPIVDSPPLAERERNADHVRSVQYFDNTTQMASASDLIVEGIVTHVSVVGIAGQDEHAVEVHQVELRLTRVLLGDPTLKTIVLEEDGIPTAYSYVGDDGFFVVVQRQDREPGIYRLVNFQGRYLRDSGGTIQRSGLESELVARMEGMTAAQFAATVEQAVAQIRSAP
jgi:hypothetical protein